MRGLRTLMLILLTTLFAVGGPLRSPAHADSVPACHAMAGETHDKAPTHKSRPDVMALGCCTGCLPAAARDITSGRAPGATVRIAFAPLVQVLDGLSPAPEHGPPRPLA